MRLGLLGGTFDPPHRGHVTVALAALQAGLDQVALIPARIPPHKDPGGISGPFHRFAMAALAVDGEERLVVSAFEVLREGPSYTIDTVHHFLESGHDVTLIMGADSLAEIDTWKDGDRLVKLTRLAVYPRAGFDTAQLAGRMPGDARVLRLAGPEIDVSATDIRRRARAGESIEGLVPPAVARYIHKHGIYHGKSEGGTD